MKKTICSFSQRMGITRLLQRVGAGRDSVYVLAYHRIGERRGQETLDPGLINAFTDQFEEQMDLLVRRYHPVDIDSVLQALRGQSPLPKDAVLVTFDDGYRDFGERAFPIMAERRIRPLLFVATGCVGGDHFWWDRLYRLLMDDGRREIASPFGRLTLHNPAERQAALSRWLAYAREAPFEGVQEQISALWDARERPVQDPAVTLNWNELRELDGKGVSIAPHSHSHPILSHLSAETARREIRLSRQRIEEEIGHVPPVFAYPDGKRRSVSQELARILREEGFELAFTMIEGRARLQLDDPLMLPRIGTLHSWNLGEFYLRLTPFYDRWKRS